MTDTGTGKGAASARADAGTKPHSVQPTHGVKIGRGTVTHWKDAPITSRVMAAECLGVIEEWTGERGAIVEVHASIPLPIRAQRASGTDASQSLKDPGVGG